MSQSNSLYTLTLCNVTCQIYSRKRKKLLPPVSLSHHGLPFPRILLPHSQPPLREFAVLLAPSPQPVNILKSLSSSNPSLIICPFCVLSNLSSLLPIFPISCLHFLTSHSCLNLLAPVSTKLHYIKCPRTS